MEQTSMDFGTEQERPPEHLPVTYVKAKDVRYEHTPGDCPHELQVVEMGSGNLKSECDVTMRKIVHSTWTNCRTWGKCVWGEIK